jgi:RNA polymerase-binding transcription factor DksA
MDETDRAQDLAEFFTATALTQHKKRVAIGDGEAYAEIPVLPRDCGDCGAPIPMARLVAVTPAPERCTFCEGEREMGR